MGSKKGGFILSWPVIIGLIFAWNLIFDDDDEKKEIDVKPQIEVVEKDTTEKPSLEVKLKHLGAKVKDVGGKFVEVVKEEFKEEFKTEEDEVDETQDIEPEKEEVAKKEKKLETLKPLEEEKEKPDNGIGMKKL